MSYFYIADLDRRAIVCYPTGDRLVFACEELANDRAHALSQINDRAFVALPVPGDHVPEHNYHYLPRAIPHRDNPLRLP